MRLSGGRLLLVVSIQAWPWGTALGQSAPGYEVTPYANVPGPMRLSVAPNGDLYVGRDELAGGGGSNTATRVHRVSNGGATVTELGITTVTDPDAVFFDASGQYSGLAGSVLVGSYLSGSSGRISRIAPDGTVTLLHSPTSVENPSEFVVDQTGRLLITDAGTGTRSGGVWFKTDATAPTQLFAQTTPSISTAYLAVDDANRIYTGSGDSRIRLYEANGTLIDDDFASFPGGYVLLEYPRGLTDFEPALLAARTTAGELYRVDADGAITTIGTGFLYPTGMRLGPDGALYLSEHGRSRILRITRRLADLSLTADADPDPIGNVGGAGTWSFEVLNLGPDVAQLTELRFALPDPAVATVDSVSTAQGACTLVGLEYVCELGDLPVGAGLTIIVGLLATGPGYAETAATVTSRSRDLNPSDAAASVSTRVLGPCGELGYAGECQGSTLRYCVAEATPGETLVSVDCATEAFPSGIVGSCAFIEDAYGHDCVAAAGGECLFDTGDGDPFVALCAGDGAGCRVDEVAGSSTCELGFEACAPPADGEAFVPYCEGALWVRDCTVNQPQLYDCGALGGGCAASGCIDLPVGAACGDNAACAAGSFCDEVTRRCLDSASVCVPRTFADRCEGETFVYCDSVRGRVSQWDCAADGYTCGAQFTCVEGPTTGRCAEVGPACVGRGAGETCAPERGVYCGPGRSCILERSALGPIEGRCRMAATCGAGDPHVGCVGQIATFCLGDGTITAAEAGGFDCASIGGRCLILASGEPGCASGPGGPCNPPSIIPNGTLVCEAGGTCRDNGDGTGTCEGGEVPDAGVTPDAGGPIADAGVTPDLGVVQKDGGVSEPPEDDGCGCTAAASAPEPGAPSLLLSLLASAALFRGRRRLLTSV